MAKFRRIATVIALFLWYGALHLLRRGKGGPDRLRLLLEKLGGTFLKFGQVLSLQPDVFTREYRDALFSLLDRVPPFDYASVERIFLDDLGRRPGELFESFNPVPMASASIGQVHAARLNGRNVAVKVRRPSVEKNFAVDLRFMKGLEGLIQLLRLKRWRWLARAIREFCTWTYEELDYRYEARFMAALFHNARGSTTGKVPETFETFTTHRILVAELLEGPTVLDYIRSLQNADTGLDEVLAEGGFDPESFALNIVRNFVSDAFHHGLFHADLHPANLIILPGNIVGYVDFGITGSLSPSSRRSMVSLTLALTRADTPAMMDHFLRLSAPDGDSDVEGFRTGLQDLVDGWFREVRDGLKLKSSFSRVMYDMLQLSRKTHLWPSDDVTRYIRSVITADGLIGMFAPGLDVNANLEAICEDYLRENVWQEWFSSERIADLASIGLRLIERGPDVLSALLDTPGDLPPRVPVKETGNRRTRVQVMLLGLIVTSTAFMAKFSGVEPHLGVNLFTAQIGVIGAGATLLLLALRRLL